jgi:hypothetical protein
MNIVKQFRRTLNVSLIIVLFLVLFTQANPVLTPGIWKNLSILCCREKRGLSNHRQRFDDVGITTSHDQLVTSRGYPVFIPQTRRVDSGGEACFLEKAYVQLPDQAESFGGNNAVRMVSQSSGLLKFRNGPFRKYGRQHRPAEKM